MGYLRWFDYFYYYLIKRVASVLSSVFSKRRAAIKLKHDLPPEEFHGCQMGDIIASLGIF